VKQEIERKQRNSEALMKALEGLDNRVEAIETAISTLDSETLHLAEELGVTSADSPKRIP
jgi:predicted  nucleic acid-binding Zn-ribbon protein